MSRSIHSKTARLTCMKLAGPKENGSPSKVSFTKERSNVTPPVSSLSLEAGRTCSHASGLLEWIARSSEGSGSRQCTQIECHRRSACSAPASVSGHKASMSLSSAGAGVARSPFQIRTSASRPVDRSSVNSIHLNEGILAASASAMVSWSKGNTTPSRVRRTSSTAATPSTSAGCTVAQFESGTTFHWRRFEAKRPRTDLEGLPFAGPTANLPRVRYRATSFSRCTSGGGSPAARRQTARSATAGCKL
mmetsp:Transcript_99667/g.286586  ORF Transcript_99667/g.286586 Transcript_99667/m.286586 type:complete len:248 (-) Transcript_99667:6-749(-)